jgi:hypothetical protein
MPRVSTKSLSDTRILRAKVKRDKDGAPLVSYLWDSSIRGFGLRITAQGTKSFCMKFMGPDGKQAWLALGPYTGEKSLEAAKEQAAAYRGMLAKGLDPRTEAKKHLLIPTFDEFVKEHLACLKDRLSDEEKAIIAVKPKWLPPYLHGTKVFLEQIALPALGALRLNEVTRNHIQALVDDTAKGRRPWMKPSEKPKKATRIAGNRLHAALSKLFTEAERKGHIAQGTNPCKLVVKQEESKGRERFLSLGELEWLGKVLKDAPRWGDKEACAYAWEQNEGEAEKVALLGSIDDLMLSKIDDPTDLPMRRVVANLDKASIQQLIQRLDSDRFVLIEWPTKRSYESRLCLKVAFIVSKIEQSQCYEL